MQLRDYQRRGFEQALKAHRRGRKSVVFVLSPGAGKTTLGSWFSVALSKLMGGKVLWVAHRRELIKQAVQTIRAIGFTAGAIAPRMKREPEALFQVASIQTLRAGRKEAIPPDVVVMVWDECHHAVSDDWVNLAKEARTKKVFLVGLTATPERSDGRGLSPLFGTMIAPVTPRELVKTGRLVPADVLVPDDVLDDGIADVPVKLWEKHAPGTRTIVFCENVDHAVEVAESFADRGHRADFVEGEMPLRERDKIIRRFARGKIDVLTNCQLLTEGFDLPPIQTVVLARTIGSQSLYLQMVGRGSRPYEGKKRYLVLDLVGNARMYGHPEDERVFSLQGRPITLKNESEIERRPRCRNCGYVFVEPARTCPVCSMPVQRVKGRKIHEKVLSRMTSAQAAAYEAASLDRLRDYARSHGKDEAWVTDKFVQKFGRLP